jgi:deoxyribodipyrimidine photo-lyase
MSSSVPAIRVRSLNDAPLRGDGSYVLYWMTAYRRMSWNHALDRAVEHARELGVPLLVFEGLRIDYAWASDRHHRFAIDGMREHRDVLAGGPIGYLPWVEPTRGAGKGLLEALASHAAVVVTDDAPFFFFPRMVSAAADRLGVRLEAVDSNGLYPIHHAQRTFTTAASFRRHLQKTLPEFLGHAPAASPTLDALPPFGGLDALLDGRWAPAPDSLLDPDGDGLAALDIDHSVPPVPFAGGSAPGRDRLERFLAERLPEYHERRNEPDDETGSRLSPYLHWGHLSSWEIFDRLTERDGWTPARLAVKPNGRREGWWNMSPEVEAFVDELVTWREIGFNYCTRENEPARYGSLPEWARETLAEHAEDPRPYVYSMEEFEAAETHDELWNAAQRELRREGTIHNYLRMLWGKKILEWSESPQAALETMVELNNRWAVDGRDPNSYSGIMWVLGRYDRGWPERDVFGKVRSMTSKSTRRKVSVDDYLRRFGPDVEADPSGADGEGT